MNFASDRKFHETGDRKVNLTKIGLFVKFQSSNVSYLL